MAKNNRKGMYAIGLIIVAVAAFYVISPESFSGLSVGGGGVQTQPPPTDIGAQTYEGPVVMNVIHRNTLDSAQPRIEGVNLVTNYYKLVGGVYKSIGSGSGNSIHIDTATNQIFMGIQVPNNQEFYVSPTSTSDSALNPRVVGFSFFDVSGDSEKEWVFTLDMTRLGIQGGQVAPTIDVYVDSFTAANPVFVDNPTDQTSISTSSGNRIFIEWDVANGPTISSAYPVYEVEISINGTQTAKWDRGSSTLMIPNFGQVNLGDFDQTRSGPDTLYTWTRGFSLESADYVTIAQNTQNKTDWDLKLVTNFGAAEVYDVILTIRFIEADLGSDEVSDTVRLST